MRKPADAVLNTAAWQGDAAPPLEPQLRAPVAELRTGAGHRPPNPIAGAPVPERRTVMVAARVTPAGLRGRLGPRTPGLPDWRTPTAPEPGPSDHAPVLAFFRARDTGVPGGGRSLRCGRRWALVPFPAGVDNSLVSTLSREARDTGRRAIPTRQARYASEHDQRALSLSHYIFGTWP